MQRSRRTSPSEKAQHQHDAGRVFLGLTDEEAERIGARLGVRIQQRLDAGRTS